MTDDTRTERRHTVSDAGETGPDFGEVFETVKRVVEARGMRQQGESLITYSEAGVTLSRTPLNEYEVRTERGDWVEEVRRIDRDVRKGCKE
jgi:hypothetical protein